MNQSASKEQNATACSLALPYLTGLLPFSFAVRIDAVYAPRYTDVALCVGVTLVFTAILHIIVRGRSFWSFCGQVLTYNLWPLPMERETVRGCEPCRESC